MSVKGKKKESAEQVCVKFWWFFICASFSLLIQLNPRAQNVFRPWRELYRRYKSCTNLFQWNRFGACTKTRWPVPLEKEIENNTCSLFHPVPPCSTQNEKRPVPVPGIGHTPRMVPWNRLYSHLNGTTRPSNLVWYNTMHCVSCSRRFAQESYCRISTCSKRHKETYTPHNWPSRGPSGLYKTLLGWVCI